MDIKRSLFVFFFFYFSLFFSHIFTQSYNIQNYTVKNGLPSGVIYGLTQSSNGEMWFTSNVGVLEFDNISWKVHKVGKKVNSVKLPSTLMWIGNDNKKIFAFYENLKLGGYYHTGSNWVRIQGLKEKGKLIIPTGMVLTKFDKKTVIGFGTYNKGFYIYSQNKWRHITKKEGLPDNDIVSVDAFDGSFYIVTKKGVSVFSGKNIDNSINGILPNKGVGVNGIRVVEINGQKTIFITGLKWIGKIQNGKFFYIKKFGFQISKEFGKHLKYRKTLIEYDRRGRLFLGNIIALYFINLRNNELKILDSYNGMTTRGITSILQDRELNIWIGTRRGISKIVSLQFENYSRKNGLLEDEVTVVKEIKPGKMVFGHNNGFTVMEAGNYKRIQLDNCFKNGVRLFNTRIFDIHIDSRKRMWVVAGASGLFLFDGNSSDYKLIKYWACKQNKEFIGIVEDKNGIVWIAGNGNVLKINKNSIRYNIYERFPKTNIRKLFVSDSNDIYYASASKGVFVQKKEKITRIYSKTNKLFNSTYALASYKKSRILVGSEGGLLEIINGKLKLFSKFNWQITMPVYFIVKDNKGFYWIGTDNGVIRFDDKNYKHFTHLDGLAGIETNRSGGFIDSSGNMWIGMDQGVSKYSEDLIKIPYKKPLLRIKKIRVNNKTFSTNDLVKACKGNSLEFFYRGISFIDFNPLNYKYKLVGYDSQWQENKFANGYIRYDNMPIGKYRFLLKAINGRGIESNICTVEKIEIKPPFYLSYWFFLLVVAVLLIFGMLLIRYFKQMKVSRLLEKEIYNRNIQLKESLLSYQSLFEESLDCIFTSTPDGMFLSINKAGLELFGYKSLKEISNKNIQKDLYVDKNRREIFKEEMRKKGYVKNFESVIRRKDGKELIVLESSYLIKNNNGDIIGYRGIIRDITEQYRLQDQLVQSQKMESIGLLAGGIAHDFNNVLSGILGYANLLKRSLQDDKKLFKYISTIEKSAERASALTSKLLGFARKGKYNIESIDANEIIKEVLNLLEALIDKAISLKSDLVKPKWLIEADATQIHQVVMNICLNAREALPNGGYIKVTTKYVKLTNENQSTFVLRAAEGLYLNISVADNGFGISEENIKKIFDPFYTTKRGTKGSGLGLSMVYGVLKNHNGALNVKSINNKGTTFDLYFPVNKKKKLVNYDTKKESDSADIIGKLQGKETILIVDDEKVHRELLGNVLNENGYKTLFAIDGVEAVEVFLENKDRIDLVILDMSMPRKSGDKVFEQIRKISPDIKVLIDSGYSLDEKIRTILANNGTDFIQKPFKPRLLLIKLKTMLNK